MSWLGVRPGLSASTSAAAPLVIAALNEVPEPTKFAEPILAEGLSVSIVEPGAYLTPIFGNLIKAADEERTNTYGVAKQIPTKVNDFLRTAAGDAQEVADAVQSIVETPVGQRKLRYRVSRRDPGVDEINALCEHVQRRLFEASGITADTAFVQRSVAGNA